MRKLPLILIILAVIATGIGIYVINTGSGNDLLTTASDETGCKVDTANADALDAVIKGDIAAMRLVDDPLDVSGLAFADRDGKPATLGDWKGRVVLFNLWATWCAPCRAEMPAFEELETTHGGEDFQVVPVSVDLGDAVKPKAFYAEINLTALPFFHEGELTIFNTLKKKGMAFGMPVTLLVDRNSCAVAVLNGPAEWAGADAVNLIQTAISLQ